MKFDYLALLGLIVFLVGFLVFVLYKPKSFVLMIISTMPLVDLVSNSYIDFEIGGLDLSQISGLFVIIGLIVILTKQKIKKFTYLLKPLFILFIFILANMMLRLFYANTSLSFLIEISIFLKILILPLMVLAILVFFKTVRDFKTIFTYISLGFILYLLSVLIIYFVDFNQLISVREGRFIGGFKSPSKIAQLLVILLPLFLFKENVKSDILTKIQIVIIFILLALTNYRTAQIGVIIFFLILSIFHKKYIYVILGLVLSISTFVYSERFQEGIGQIVLLITEIFKGSANNLDYNLFSGRIGLWQILISDLISSHPLAILVGKGLGQASSIIKTVGGREWAAHNGYIQLIVDVGIIGLMLYFWFLYKTFCIAKESIKKFDKSKNISFIFIATLVMHLVLSLSTNVVLGNFLYSLYFGVVIALFLSSTQSKIDMV